MGPEADRGAPLPLLVWLSPAFPVGAFAYSHGLEWAVEAGDIADAASLRDWLVDLLEFRRAAFGRHPVFGRLSRREPWPTGRRSWRSTNSRSRSRFRPSAVWRRPRRERRSSARRARPGIASRSGASIGPKTAPSPIRSRSAQRRSGHGLALRASLEAFALAQVGQSRLRRSSARSDRADATGQTILAELLPRIRALAGGGRRLDALDDLGGCAFRSDIAAMRHETQYSRLFRS